MDKLKKSLQDANKRFVEQKKYSKELCHDLLKRIENYKVKNNQPNWANVGDFGHLIQELEELNQFFGTAE